MMEVLSLAKVDYGKLRFSKFDKQLYGLTVLDNPYITVTPYAKQAAAIMYDSQFKLLGGNAFSGKSIMGSVIASQWLMYSNYRCLVLRRTMEDVVAAGGIVDYLKQYLLDEERLGDNVCTLNEAKHVFIAPSGAKIYYDSSNRVGDKEKFRSRSYQTIIWDEASESPKENLSFIKRSSREWGDTPIPLRVYYISNPSLGSGTKFLLDNFVDDGTPFPYFEMTFQDNPYIDRERYRRTLETLDPIDRAFQLYGDWHFVPSEGMIMTQRDFREQEVSPKFFKDKIPAYNVVGVDLASTGDDKTALISIVRFTDGTNAIMDSLTISDSNIEEPIRQFLHKQQSLYRCNKIIFEKEQGASPEFAKRYFYGQLEDLLLHGLPHNKKTALDFYHPQDTKFERARGIAHAISSGYVKINQRIPDKHALLNQFLYIHPSKEVMKDYPSPDVLDATSLAFNEFNSVFTQKHNGIFKAYSLGVR